MSNVTSEERAVRPLRIIAEMMAAVALALLWPLLAMLPLAAVGIVLGIPGLVVGGGIV